MEFKDASRKDVRVKMALASGAGGGKTFGALEIMLGLFAGDLSKVGVLQTEAGRAQCYLKKGPFKVLEMSPPFSPEKFIQGIEAAEAAGLKGLIIDSISDEWAGLGGALDMHQDVSEVTKNSFTAWKKVTPKHEAVFNKILSSPIHIICTVKKKIDYVMEPGTNGKVQPKRVGVKDIQREGSEYRWMIQFDLDQETNLATVAKDNTGLFQGKPAFKITADTGKIIRDWCLGE